MWSDGTQNILVSSPPVTVLSLPSTIREMVHAQEPTCTNLRIRSTQDTHKIFYAIQKGNLKMVTRRLDADERQALQSGCVYAWEERGPHSEITGLGIERFTEGRRWTPSRVRDEFLFYYERYMPPADATGSVSPADTKPPRDWEPLVKQTYSVWVETDNGKRKWHITAYFTQGTIDQLRCVDDIPGVGDLIVPDGHFKSTRVGKRAKTDESKGESSKSSVSRTYAAFPSPYSSTSPAVESPSVLMYEPYRDTTSEAQQSGLIYQAPSHHSDDTSQMRSASQAHQNRSSHSLSPPLSSSRMQYVAQAPPYNPALRIDMKPSRITVPLSHDHTSHPHPSDYRAHSSSSLALSGAVGPMSDATHGQRGKHALEATYTDPHRLNHRTVNRTVDSTPEPFTQNTHWDNTASTVYAYRQPSISPGLPPTIQSPVHGLNNHADNHNIPMHTGYNMYPMHQPQAPQQHYHPPTTMNHNNGMPSLPQEYIPTTDPMALTTHTPENLRVLPPLQIPYEEPPQYMYSAPGSDYQQIHSQQPIPVATPPPTSIRDAASCRPLALAPLHTLNRAHPYRRERQDDKALRLLQQNGSSSSSPPG